MKALGARTLVFPFEVIQIIDRGQLEFIRTQHGQSLENTAFAKDKKTKTYTSALCEAELLPIPASLV